MMASTSDNSEESAKIKAEIESLRKEFSWLLETEYLQKVEAIRQSMESCGKRYSSVLSSNAGGEIRPILLKPTQQMDDSVFCKATVEGDKISKADIQLKLPGRGNKPIRTGIREHAAWKLRQIQDSSNYFLLAEEMCESIMQKKESFKSPKEIEKAFSDLSVGLRLAEEVLVLPQLPLVEEIYSAEQKSHLKPELPEDIVLHFHIGADTLVLTILTVSQAQKTSSSGHQKKSSENRTASAPWVGATFEHGPNVYEVINQIQVSSQVRWLQEVLLLLRETQEMAQDLIDKVKVFSGFI